MAFFLGEAKRPNADLLCSLVMYDGMCRLRRPPLRTTTVLTLVGRNSRVGTVGRSKKAMSYFVAQ